MLQKFRFVNHEGITALNYKGRNIPLDKIDDTLAEQLIGKTHVLERVPGTEPAATPEALALPEATGDKKKAE